MTMPRFARFLALAREHTALLAKLARSAIVDLCADADLLSRAQLLHYLEHHGVPAAQKDALIDELGQAALVICSSQDLDNRPCPL